ncbi:hypothetical protein [Thermaurantiacus tibetensis]|uniref:hypothetical protein n=1 Tax=Thermaurantiacus tibetensis TaxID=2759035 RepID=UPI001A9C674E|nr:hypothetical protein [Thermaurantiacus tibetensis]
MAFAWRIGLLGGSLLLCGCAVSKEARIRAVLTDAGVPRPIANCMAKPMADDLTVEQLRAMADAASMMRRPPGEVTLEQALRALRTVGDPAIVGTLALATAGCIGRN